MEVTTEGTLIELVQSFRHLYDLKDKNFKNNEMKENSWRTISQILGVSGIKQGIH